ncbi:hypothetical protein [Paenibacillus tundrae]|uniref:Uncharacterized protein n=1 Tax=Paenibacillus tundrae TaxID=528187 RepID=A0ABT9WB83_9BACL|nr:hypothetical protein [Paenibacillus tundrae]MDQ0170516.1 hypothetical protein [Paenibacillus tundrae]
MNFQLYDELFNRDNYPAFSPKDYLPMDNKMCVCLSGDLYENCCKKEVEDAKINRKIDPYANEILEKTYSKKDKKLLSYITEDKSLNKKNISYCAANKVFGDCDNKNHMRRSHTLARGIVLKNLSGGEKVIRFNDHKINSEQDKEAFFNTIGKSGYSEVDIEDASVTVSFCKKHDIELFSSIETDGNGNYSGNNIQNLEYALKSISFDIYYNIMNIKFLSELIKETKYVAFNPDGSNSSFFQDYNLRVNSLFDLYPLMLKVLEELKLLLADNKEPSLETVSFELPLSKVNFSLSEIMIIDDTICFANCINAGKPYIIISYYKNNERIASLDKWKEQYNLNQSNKIGELKSLWPLIKGKFLINAQNIYFNKEAFDKLSDLTKGYLYVIHREGTKDIPDKVQVECDEELMRILYGL